ncbi:PLP-dependent aminotransferase family protein [candidate division KSB1 bacterium]|nr:PLP-dependent aminotransferase family protein [candidate division KSB1 bacterium]
MLRFSQSANALRSSAIRELMNMASDPNIITFTGGMPNNTLFPTEEIDEIYNNLPIDVRRDGFQYCPTTGYPPLLNSLKEFLRQKGLPVDNNELIITTGSLQAINLIAKVFIDPGDRVITENPAFIGAISVFKSYQAKLDPVDIDEDGIVLPDLEKMLQIKSPEAKILYITPYFHNPAGIVYSQKRKTELLDMLKGQNIVLLEDDAYGELYFDQKDRELTKPIKTIPRLPVPVCYTTSLSKYLGPGLRLGCLLAPPDIFEKCELAKQSLDACSSTFTQVLAHEFLVQNKISGYLEKLRKVYLRRSQIMLAALQQYMPEQVTWTKPRGGFYIWVKLPEIIDATDILKKSIKSGAVFVIGQTFDPLGKKNNCFRLAFSHTPEDRIEEGIKIIASALKESMIN